MSERADLQRVVYRYLQKVHGTLGGCMPGYDEGGHCAECEGVCDLAGYDSWEEWQDAVNAAFAALVDAKD